MDKEKVEVIEELEEIDNPKEAKDLIVDESKLTKDDLEEYQRRNIPVWLLIAIGVIVLLMIGCIIVISLLSK